MLLTSASINFRSDVMEIIATISAVVVIFIFIVHFRMSRVETRVEIMVDMIEKLERRINRPKP